MSQSRSRAVAALVVLLTAVGFAGCGGSQRDRPSASAGSTRFVYDSGGRLAAVQSGGTTAVYRYDEAGNRVGVSRVKSRSFEPSTLRPQGRAAPEVTGVPRERVAQGATVTIAGHGFDPDPLGNVVEVGGALGRVVSAEPTELRVQLPPVAVPGPVTVSTAYGRSTSRDELVVVPAEVSPADVTALVRTAVGRTLALPTPDGAGLTMLTFHGDAGSTVELRLDPEGEACDTTEVGLAGPTGTIIEAGAGEASWCGRPARLPMTGTYTVTVSQVGGLRGRIGVLSQGAKAETPRGPTGALSTEPVRAGPADFPVDLSSGSLVTQVSDLGLGGSGAANLTRSFTTGDQDLPALAPEEPLARHWSVGASLALQPSVSNSYLDVVLPDGIRLPYRRVTPGAPEPTGAVFEPTAGAGSGPFAGSRVAYTGSGWELRTQTGTVLGFGRTGSPLRLSWIRAPDGQTARFIRAPDGEGPPELLGVVSEDGQWARFTYDPEHRITGATDQAGDLVGYRYARPAGVSPDLLVAATYRPAGGQSTTVGYRYQRLTGRLAAVTDGSRDVLRFRYDEAGRVLRQEALTAPGARTEVWRYSYDLGRRRVSIPRPSGNGRTATITLPEVRRAVVTGPSGRRTVTLAGGRVAKDSSGGTRGSGPVGAVGGPAEALPAGYFSGVFVDARGRPRSITDPDGASTRLGYTDAGDIASVTDPAGTTRYGWDEHGRQVSGTDPLGGRQRWRYDRAGRLVWSQDARGIVSTFGYDRFGRPAETRFGVRPGRPPESRVDYAYDRSGRLARIRDSAADGPLSFRYDQHGNLAAEVSSTGTLVRLYDASGRRTGLALPGAASVGSDNDAKGRATGLVLDDHSQSARVAARYDGHGRLSGLDLPGGVRGRFSYSEGQLTGLTYDSGGRRIGSQSAAYDGSGRLSALGGSLARLALPETQRGSTYDAAHQTAQMQWDRTGNLLRDSHHRYTWDARGRLVQVVGPEGLTRFRYDALGRRTSATTGGSTVRYVYDGEDVVQYVAADGTRTTYLRGPDGTPLASTSSGGTTTYLPDMLGNVGASVGANGTVRRFSYDPFGVPAQPQGADQPGFRGLLADPLGQLPMGARTYDPGTGRFISRDTWGIEGGDSNLYRYAVGAPTVYMDPSGHASECVGLALGWAMSVLGPGGGWDDFDALGDKVQSGQISEDQWTVGADKLSHDIWSGFDVVANVCGTSAVGSSVAALPLLGSSKVAGRVLGSLADDAVTGAAATRLGSGVGRLQPGVSLRAANTERRLISSRSVRFTQDSARATFRDGRSIFDLANDMAATGKAPASLPPIRLFIRNGNIYSLDNRRLFAGQYADVDLPYRWATRSAIREREESQLLDGTSVLIRLPGGRRNWEWWQP